MEDGSLWKWSIIFLNNAVMYWKGCAAFFTTTRWRENSSYHPKTGCAFIRNTAVR